MCRVPERGLQLRYLQLYGWRGFQQYCDCNLKYPVAHNGEGYFNALFGTIYY